MKKTLAIFLLSLTSILANEITLIHKDSNFCENNECRASLYDLSEGSGMGGPKISFGGPDSVLNQLYATNFQDTAGLFLDLGDRPCSYIGDYRYDELREEDPFGWFKANFFLFKLFRDGVQTIEPKVGHCYLVHQMNDEKMVFGAFNVKELVESEKVVLNEIEIFRRADLN